MAILTDLYTHQAAVSLALAQMSHCESEEQRERLLMQAQYHQDYSTLLLERHIKNQKINIREAIDSALETIGA